MDHLSNPLYVNETLGDKRLKICVIGAGAAGLSALKIIRDSQGFKAGCWTIDAYEARDDAGGVWLPAPPTDDPPLTPMYDSLTTNLPHPIMSFPSLQFPPGTPLFPKASVVGVYLRAYAKEFDLMQHVRLKVSVSSTSWTGSAWKVDLSTGEGLEYDRLIVANGHYRVPYYPPIPGLDEWIKDKRVIHSAWYRSPHYVGDVVLVVGGGPSGNDLSDEMRNVCTTLIHSTPKTPPKDDGNVKIRGRVVRFSLSSRTAHFSDGTSESGIDHVFLATGYLTSFPFFRDLQSSMPAPIPPFPSYLHNSGFHVFPLARDLFPLQADFPATSAAFLGLPVRVVPFPLFEAQMRAVVRVFADPSVLDPQREALALLDRYEALRSAHGGDDPAAIAHAWHRYQDNEQFAYRDALHAFAGFGGEEWRVPAWVIKYYEKKDVLRREWRALEAAGEAERYVEGVGKGGVLEWIELMRQIVERAGGEAAPSYGEAKL